MPENVQLRCEILLLSLVTYITVDFKKLTSDLSHAGSALVENECSKRKTRLQNSPETFPYKVQKHLAIHQSDVTLLILSLKFEGPMKTCFRGSKEDN